MKTYRLPTEDIRRDIYLIHTIFYASKNLASMGAEKEFNHIHDLMNTFEEKEVLNRLIHIAVLLRILHTRFIQEFPSSKKLLSITGTLIPDISCSCPQEKVLTMREACNKIVHCEKYNIEKAGDETKLSPMLPFITLEGTYYKKKWKAKIDLKEFLRDAFHTSDALIAEICE